MRRSRPVLVGLLLLVLVALALPAASLAGGSAGDQQYTDPFSGATTHAATTTTRATTTASAAPTSASAAPATTPAASTDSTVATADPTATVAGSSTATLPNTGYDAWTVAGFGLTLLVGGAGLRRRMGTRRR